MTPQEASEELKEEFEIFKNCIHKADWDNPNEELKKIIEANTMAIEVLGQQSCEDCISRADVLALAEKGTLVSNGNYKSICKAINELPSVTPKTGWIPVSERLPEDGEDVLVWYEYFRYGEYNCMYQTYGIGYQYDGCWGGSVCGTNSRCIAWMPLPQPYKAESEE